MKEIIVIAVICFVVWSYYQKQTRHGQAMDSEQPELVAGPAQTGQEPRFQPETRFRCDGRKYCSQMTSRAEAEFFVRNCPNTKMDGDNDGVPCENDSRF